jgi:hypothetical protein
MFLDLGFGLDFGLDSDWVGGTKGRDGCFDYTLATVFDVACWADGDKRDQRRRVERNPCVAGEGWVRGRAKKRETGDGL